MKNRLEKIVEIKREQLYDLYMQAPFCMGILEGPNHVYEMTSVHYLQLIGKKDIIGKTVKEVSPELEAQSVFNFLNTVYKTGKPFSANEILMKLDLHGNGKMVDAYLNFIFRAHRNSSGAVDGIFFFANDVTVQVLSRKKIEEREKRYWELIQNLPVATYSCDDQGCILMHNKVAELWGIEPETGKDIWNFSGTVYNSKDNNPIIIEKDLTERKKAELNHEQQNKELVKTNAELDRFVYSVSHDLRSPLMAILGLISFIEEESRETNTLEHVKMIRNSINRLDKYIKNIVDYARNNRTILEVKKVPLQKTVAAIVDVLHSMKEAKGIHFEIDIKELQPFYSDKLRFKTIMENLISNAIKYHKKAESGNYIKITGQSDLEKLQLSIADNGIGIAPAYHNKIFDMFFRLSGEKDGSGIGLYIVKDTVEILQGSIQVQSEKGVGTTFIVTLKNLKP